MLEGLGRAMIDVTMGCEKSCSIARVLYARGCVCNFVAIVFFFVELKSKQSDKLVRSFRRPHCMKPMSNGLCVVRALAKRAVEWVVCCVTLDD